MRIEPATYDGHFWKPGEEVKNKCSGKLIIENGGEIRLEMMGELPEEVGKIFGEPKKIGRIVGKVATVGDVTLENCHYLKRTYDNGNFFISVIFVTRALLKINLEAVEEPVLHELCLSVDNLNEWASISGLEPEKITGYNYAVKYKTPAPIVIQAREDLKLALIFNFTASYLPGPIVKLRERTMLKIMLDNPAPLNELRILAHQITCFLCIAMGVTVCINEMEGTLSKSDPNISLPTKFTVIDRSLPFAEKPLTVYSHSIPIPLGAIIGKLDTVFAGWLANFQNLSPPISLYVLSKAGAQEFPDGKFLAMAQCLETLHRRISKATGMQIDEYETLLNTLIAACPEKRQTWLRQRLSYGYEPFFGDRIMQLVTPFKKLLGGGADLEKLKNRIVSSRNFYTHYSEGLREKAAKGAELHSLYYKMEAIFFLNILKIIGLDTDEISTLCNSQPFWKDRIRNFKGS